MTQHELASLPDHPLATPSVEPLREEAPASEAPRPGLAWKLARASAWLRLRALARRVRETRALTNQEPESIEAAARLLAWVRDYVGTPHPELGRNGPICPFVPMALHKRRLWFTLRADLTPSSPAGAIDLALLEHARQFLRERPERTPDDALNCLVVGFPRLDDAGGAAVDGAHSRQKGFLMSQGLMLSQFHSSCVKPGVHNRDFPLYRAPFPCLVLRHMGLHDIVFVDHHPRAFGTYRQRFGERYDAGQLKDERGYATRYAQALARFSQPDAKPELRSSP